eukprot:gene7241-350_t
MSLLQMVKVLMGPDAILLLAVALDRAPPLHNMRTLFEFSCLLVAAALLHSASAHVLSPHPAYSPLRPSQSVISDGPCYITMLGSTPGPDPSPQAAPSSVRTSLGWVSICFRSEISPGDDY